MTNEQSQQMEEQVSLQDLFDVYAQRAPWDQYKFHMFLNSKLPQNKLEDTPFIYWLVFRSQIGIEILSGWTWNDLNQMPLSKGFTGGHGAFNLFIVGEFLFAMSHCLLSSSIPCFPCLRLPKSSSSEVTGKLNRSFLGNF